MDLNSYLESSGNQPLAVNECGIPQRPANSKYTDLYHAIIYSKVLPVASPGPILTDERQSVDTEGDFHCCAILGKDAAYVRFLWPNGRYSSNVRQRSSNFYALGKFRHSENPRRICPPGSYIGIELETQTGADINVVIVFEGFVRVYR